MSMTHRTLVEALSHVEVVTQTRREWDTEEGEAFIREVMAAERAGHDIEDLARDLDIPNLRYVVRSRERFLR